MGRNDLKTAQRPTASLSICYQHDRAPIHFRDRGLVATSRALQAQIRTFGSKLVARRGYEILMLLGVAPEARPSGCL